MANTYPYQKSEENGIKRARAKGIFLLHAPKSETAKVLKKEFGALEHPGIYLLGKNGTKDVYVGESADLESRIGAWAKKPPKELKEWNNVILINDMRQIKYSDFANSDVRKKIEKLLIQVLKENNFNVVNKQEAQPKLSDEQSRQADNIFLEIEFLITEYRLIQERKKEKVKQEEIPIGVVEEMLIQKGHRVDQLGAYEGKIDGKVAFVRDGSQKAKGWQITLRDTFRESVRDADGFLLVNRGNCLLIPFAALRNFLGDHLNEKTVDIFIKFISKVKATVVYKESELDVSKYLLVTK